MRASAWCYIVMWLFLTHSWQHTKHYSIDCTDYLRHFERIFLYFGGFSITYLYLPTWNQYTECFRRILLFTWLYKQDKSSVHTVVHIFHDNKHWNHFQYCFVSPSVDTHALLVSHCFTDNLWILGIAQKV